MFAWGVNLTPLYCWLTTFDMMLREFLNDFLSRVCTPDAKIPVFDSKQNCEKNTKLGYKGNICNKLDNIIFTSL